MKKIILSLFLVFVLFSFTKAQSISLGYFADAKFVKKHGAHFDMGIAMKFGTKVGAFYIPFGYSFGKKDSVNTTHIGVEYAMMPYQFQPLIGYQMNLKKRGELIPGQSFKLGFIWWLSKKSSGSIALKYYYEIPFDSADFDYYLQKSKAHSFSFLFAF